MSSATTDIQASVTTHLVREVKKAINTLDTEAIVYLFGSRARGDAQPDSDWDFFVATTEADLRAFEQALLNPIYDLMVEQEALIQYIVFPKDRWLRGDSPSPLYDDVRSQGVRL